MDRETLRSLVRVMVGDEDSARWEDATIDHMIFMGIKQLSTILKTETTSDTVTLTTGVGSLPVDFISVERVTFNDNPIFKMDRREIKDLVRPDVVDVPWAYWISGDSVINSWPPVDGDIVVEYVKLADDYLMDSTSTDRHLGHNAEQYLMHYAAWLLLLSVPDTETATMHANAARELEGKLLTNVLVNDADGSPRIYSPNNNHHYYSGDDLWRY